MSKSKAGGGGGTFCLPGTSENTGSLLTTHSLS